MSATSSIDTGGAIVFERTQVLLLSVLADLGARATEANRQIERVTVRRLTMFVGDDSGVLRTHYWHNLGLLAFVDY
jgi:hypothetical protein